MGANTRYDRYKQIIIARYDIGMSDGKLAAQVSHASMAFLTHMMREGAFRRDADTVGISFDVDYGLWRGWLDGKFTKVVLGIRDRRGMDEVVARAIGRGMVEDEDFFRIYDDCSTELVAEEPDGTCLTCIGFRPMPDSRIDPVTRGIRLYTGRGYLR